MCILIECIYSVWVFTLLGIEAIKTYRAHPYLEYVYSFVKRRGEGVMLTECRIASAKVPTWITPLALIVVTSVLIPHTSFLGHLCAVTVGYLCESTNLKTCRLHS